MKQGRIHGIDRPLPIKLGKLPGLNGPAAVPEEHEGPVLPAGVLLVSIITGVDDQSMVHHRPVPFGHGFQLLHQLDQHAAIILANLHPNLVIWLGHVPEIVSLFIDPKPLPRSKDFATARANG